MLSLLYLTVPISSLICQVLSAPANIKNDTISTTTNLNATTLGAPVDIDFFQEEFETGANEIHQIYGEAAILQGIEVVFTDQPEFIPDPPPPKITKIDLTYNYRDFAMGRNRELHASHNLLSGAGWQIAFQKGKGFPEADDLDPAFVFDLTLKDAWEIVLDSHYGDQWDGFEVLKYKPGKAPGATIQGAVYRFRRSHEDQVRFCEVETTTHDYWCRTELENRVGTVNGTVNTVSRVNTTTVATA